MIVPWLFEASIIKEESLLFLSWVVFFFLTSEEELALAPEASSDSPPMIPLMLESLSFYII